MKTAIQIATDFLRQHYPDADSAIAAGSIIRGEGKKTSDIDLIVLFPKLKNAFRNSCIFKEQRFEVFVHDPETAQWFMEDEKQKGRNALAHMIGNGISFPKETPLCKKVKNSANRILKNGPRPLHTSEVLKLRYTVTDMVDDLRDERSHEDLVACAVCLYPLLAELVFRNAKKWVARGKWIPRELRDIAPELEAAFHKAFEDVFVHNSPERLITLSERILSPWGGFYWEGWRTDAPKAWRKKR